MSVLSIYPILITLAFAVAVLWGFALHRFICTKPKFISGIGITAIAMNLCVENSYYFAGRMLGPEQFSYFSYLEGPVSAMKLIYVLGLFCLIMGFGVGK